MAPRYREHLQISNLRCAALKIRLLRRKTWPALKIFVTFVFAIPSKRGNMKRMRRLCACCLKGAGKTGRPPSLKPRRGGVVGACARIRAAKILFASLRCSSSLSFILGRISCHGLHAFHGWETRRFLSVPSVKSVVAFLWLRLAAPGLRSLLSATEPNSVGFKSNREPADMS